MCWLLDIKGKPVKRLWVRFFETYAHTLTREDQQNGRKCGQQVQPNTEFFKKDFFNKDYFTQFFPHACVAFWLKSFKRLYYVLIFFNVLGIGHKNGEDEELCDEFFTCDLEQTNEMQRLCSDPSPSCQPESMQSHLGSCIESVTSVLLFLKGCLHKWAPWWSPGLNSHTALWNL